MKTIVPGNTNHINSKHMKVDPRDLVVKTSGLHGNGLFTQKILMVGQYIMDYEGQRLDEGGANSRQQQREALQGSNHTVLWSLSDGMTIDGQAGGNSSIYINHSCEPNIYAEERQTKYGLAVSFYALHDIDAGDELLLDYCLSTGEPLVEEDLVNYRCLCGTPSCRGTMLDLSFMENS